MEADGFAQSAPATDVMGHPGTPLAFLAIKLHEIGGLGGQLNAGDIAITGAPVRSFEVRAGSKLHADFGPLGTIDLDFTCEPGLLTCPHPKPAEAVRRQCRRLCQAGRAAQSALGRRRKV